MWIKGNGKVSEILIVLVGFGGLEGNEMKLITARFLVH
jgi:hypothetical protein